MLLGIPASNSKSTVLQNSVIGELYKPILNMPTSLCSVTEVFFGLRDFARNLTFAHWKNE